MQAPSFASLTNVVTCSSTATGSGSSFFGFTSGCSGGRSSSSMRSRSWALPRQYRVHKTLRIICSNSTNEAERQLSTALRRCSNVKTKKVNTLGFHGADDGNRTRTVSLGIYQLCSNHAS